MRAFLMILVLAECLCAQSTEQTRKTIERALPLLERSANEFVAKRDAAMAINDSALRNSTLAAVAIDAAASAQDDVVKSAIGEIRDTAVKNQTAANAALKLAECKKLAQATEVAKMINDTAVRNGVLARLAKGESGE